MMIGTQVERRKVIVMAGMVENFVVMSLASMKLNADNVGMAWSYMARWRETRSDGIVTTTMAFAASRGWCRWGLLLVPLLLRARHGTAR